MSSNPPSTLRRPLMHPLTWELWSLSAPLTGYILLLCAVWTAAATLGLAESRFRADEGLIFVLLIGCGAVAVEVTRTLGEPAGLLAKDVLAAWLLPIALVLPPVYSLFAPLPLLLLTQYRVRWVKVHRRVFTALAAGLANAVASVTFHRISTGWGIDPLRPGRAALVWAGLALLVALAAHLMNTLMIAVAVKAASPEEALRGIFWDPESVLTDSGELCIGVMLGVLCALHPVLALIALPPVVLLQRALLHDQLSAAARLDAKTGLLNAPTWEREAASEIARAVRTGSSLSVLLLDLDHFKAVNDLYGHLAGDDVLIAVADVMRGQLREYDQCARFGGDEFAVLLPQSDVHEAIQTAERIRRRVADLNVQVGGRLVHTSVSIGIAELGSPQQGVTDLLAIADLSLYRAKESRDQVHSAVHDDPPERRHF